jgi:hypothetical protein
MLKIHNFTYLPYCNMLKRKQTNINYAAVILTLLSNAVSTFQDTTLTLLEIYVLTDFRELIWF